MSRASNENKHRPPRREIGRAGAILARRQASSPPSPTGARGDLQHFLRNQLDRINRVCDKQIERVRGARRHFAKQAIERNGTELQVDVRGHVGSDAHLEDGDV